MDSVTQIALGAAVGEATAGRETGRTAPLWGAALGLLPDLDVLANPFLTDAQALTFHRSLTHSFVFIALVTLGAGLLLQRLHPEASAKRWAGLTAAVLLTHVGLDCLTTYGTQVFWPFSTYPVIFGTVFVIDPLYTLPLIGGLLLSFRWTPTARARRWANYAGLALSSGYLLLTIVNKAHVQRVFAENLADQHPSTERVLTSPTPFNNLLWRGVAEGKSAYYVGFYSLLDPDRSIEFRRVPKGHDRLGTAAQSPIVQRLRRFSRSYYAVRTAPDGSLVIHDLRFGRNDLGLTAEGEYLFTFRLQQAPDGQVVGMTQTDPPLRLNAALLRRFAARIGGRNVPVADLASSRRAPAGASSLHHGLD